MGMVDLDPMDNDADCNELKTLIENHFNFTGSTVAEKILADWDNAKSQFVKVMPTDFKRVLNEQAKKKAG